MALVNCPECGRENVSDSAERCPGCGFGLKSYYVGIKERERKHILEQKKAEELFKARQREAQMKKEKEEQVNREIGQIAQHIKLPTKRPYINGMILGGIGFALLGALLVFAAIFGEDGGFDFVTILFIALEALAAFAFLSEGKSKLKIAQELYDKNVNSPQEYKRALAEIKYNEEQLKETQRQNAVANRQANQEREKQKKAWAASGRCPKCGSSSSATINSGYSVVTGFVGSGSPVNVCQACGYKFKPGKK